MPEIISLLWNIAILNHPVNDLDLYMNGEQREIFIPFLVNGLGWVHFFQLLQ